MHYFLGIDRKWGRLIRNDYWCRHWGVSGHPSPQREVFSVLIERRGRCGDPPTSHVWAEQLPGECWQHSAGSWLAGLFWTPFLTTGAGCHLSCFFSWLLSLLELESCWEALLVGWAGNIPPACLICLSNCIFSWVTIGATLSRGYHNTSSINATPTCLDTRLQNRC